MAEAPSTSDLLNMWEAGDGLSAPERALIALGPAWPDHTLQDLKGLSVGSRNAALVSARRALSGQVMNCLVQCPSCGDSLEFQQSTDEFLQGYQFPTDPHFVVQAEGYHLSCRMLDSSDLIAVSGEDEIEAARTLLISRSILGAKGPDGDDAEEIPPSVIAALAAHLDDADPLADLTITLRCDNCQHVWAAGFDIMAFLWAEIVRRAQDALEDVRQLARLYSWTEQDILEMSDARRAFYLEAPK